MWLLSFESKTAYPIFEQQIIAYARFHQRRFFLNTFQKASASASFIKSKLLPLRGGFDVHFQDQNNFFVFQLFVCNFVVQFLCH